MCVSERLHIHCRFWLAVNIWTNTPNVFGFSEGQSSSSDDENLPNLEESLVRAYTKLVGALYQQHVLEEYARYLDLSRFLGVAKLLGVPKWPTEITSGNIVNSDFHLTENLKAICSRLNRMYYKETQNAILQHLHTVIMDWTQLHSNIFERLSSDTIWSVWNTWKLANKTVPKWTTPIPQHILEKAQLFVKIADRDIVKRTINCGPKIVHTISQYTQTDSSVLVGGRTQDAILPHDALVLDMSTQLSDDERTGYTSDGTGDIPPIRMESPSLNISSDGSFSPPRDDLDKYIDNIIDNMDTGSFSNKITKRKGENIAPDAKRKTPPNTPSYSDDNSTTVFSYKYLSNMVPLGVHIHERLYGQSKDEWQPPKVEFELIVLGDGSIKGMNKINPIYLNRLSIHSYPDAHIRHISMLLRKGSVFESTRHVILAVGVRDKSPSFLSTIMRHASSLISNARSKFPNAQLYFPKIAQKLSPYQTEQFNLLYEFLTTKGVMILTNPDSVNFISDQIHYTDYSAAMILQHWLGCLKKVNT